jgi:hypothetical protein
MKTLQAKPQNGQKVENAKVVEMVKPSEVVKTTTAEETAKNNVEKFLEHHKPEAHKSAESRIERMKQFEALSTRYNQLKEKDNQLKTFEAGNDKLSAKVVFKNAQGFEFSANNSTVIEKLIEAGRKELSILLSEAENEVLTFEI